MKLTLSMMLVAAGILLVPLSFAQTQAPDPTPAEDSQAQPRAATQSVAAPDGRLAGMMPAGMTQDAVCAGFKSLGDCSAALHISRNLNIPFADLRDRVASGQSLAVAVHALQPSADTDKEVHRAEAQAREDLKPGG